MQALKHTGPSHCNSQAQLLMRESYLTGEETICKEKKLKSKSKVSVEAGRDQPIRMMTGGKMGLESKAVPDDKNTNMGSNEIQLTLAPRSR